LSNALPSPEELVALYEKMVLLRRFEAAAQVACRKGETPGFFHLYIGEEATAVGVSAHLRPTDWVTSTHRGHGHALAKGMTPDVLMAELYGKRDGCCGGRGGTMHLYDRRIGLFGTNGIVAAGISHAVGAGLSARARGTDDIGVAFFGDGATNHGGFHEALNFAGIQKAPVVFICENNLYGEYSPIARTTPVESLADRADAYAMAKARIDGNDVDLVHATVSDAVARGRRGEGPTLIEALTYRHKGHSRTDPATYRPEGELEAWLERDPILLHERALERDGVGREQLEQVAATAERAVAEALERALSWPQPDPQQRLEHVWA
jgi:2-oxoisovalerate dehydrogenase E1 component